MTHNTFRNGVNATLREQAFYVSFAYVLAFLCALQERVERALGRPAYTREECEAVMPLESPIWDALWRARATSDHARRLAHKLADDAELRRTLVRDCPGLAALAEDRSRSLLAELQ